MYIGNQKMIQETLQINGKRETIQQKMLGNLTSQLERKGWIPMSFHKQKYM